MFGFVVGSLCLVGFVKVWRHRGWRASGWHGRRFGRRGHWALYRAFQELDTSPGQEKAIREAVGELRRSFETLGPQLDGTRREVASALRNDEFDVLGVEASFDRQTTEFGRLRSVVATALAKIHDALDPDQRRRLARLIEAGAAC